MVAYLPLCLQTENIILGMYLSGFMEAYGFFYRIIDIMLEDPGEKVYQIIAHYNPEGLLDSHLPLTAIFMEEGFFRLERNYEHEMPMPAGVRGISKMREGRIVPLKRDSKDKNILRPRNPKTKIEHNERIKILVNWDPSKIQYGKSD